MCYNKNVKVTIKSEGGNWTDCKTSRGTLIKDGNGVKITYSLDGDECTLTVKGSVVSQERKGAQNVAITFEEGKRTLCTIGCGGFCGSFDILTRKINVNSSKEEFRLSLEYLNGSDNELIRLTLSAK